VIDIADILRNMSVPPGSIVRYDGLSGPTSAGTRAATMTGRIVAFRAPQWPDSLTLEGLCQMLEHPLAGDLESTLTAMIERRATELPLPDGVLLVEHQSGHHCPWPDLLSFLVATTKSTGRVWLRSKRPSLSRVANSRSLSMFIPPLFVDPIPEERP
jgi:hypothetical protein